MIAWRICQRPYASLDGEGARLNGGRWNAPGLPMCYLSEHPALAMLEVLVHLDLPYDLLPNDYVLLTVVVPDDLATKGIDHFEPPDDPTEYGTNWLLKGESAVLWVPSAVLPQSYNLLLNPRHADMKRIAVEAIEPFKLDARLF